MGSGDAPVRCPTPFAHGPASPTRGCASSGTPPRWQTLLNRLSSANPLAHTPGAVGLHHPSSAASAKMHAKIDNGIHHHHSRLAPPTLHRVALEASTSIAYHHTPVSSPRPCKPRAAQHLNPLFRTESPKTEVQTAIAVLQAAEAEKERIREERRDARAAAKEAKRHAGDTRGAAQRAAQSRAEILAHHRPARTDSLKDASDSDDLSDSNGETSSLSSLETNEKASGNKRKHQTHAHDHHTRSKVAKRRKKETKHKHRHHHHHSKHHSKRHSKRRHRSKRHSKHVSHSAARKRDRDTSIDDADDTSAVTARVQLRTDVDNRAKLDANDERKGRMEAEAVGMRRVWSKTGLSNLINRSCGNLVGMIENAYGSFIAGGEGGGGAPMSAASPRPDSPIPA